MKKLIIALIIVLGLTGMAHALPYNFLLKPDFTWDAPTLNVDGTPYMDASGYVVYCKPASQSDFTDALSFRITDPTVTEILSANFPCLGIPGLIDFAVTAIDTSGNESGFSNVVSVPLVEEVVPNAPTNLK